MPAVRRPAHRDDDHVPMPRLPVRHHHRSRDQRPGDRAAARLRGARGRRQHSNPSRERCGASMANAAPTPKAVALVLLPALVLMLAFAFSYVGAFHDPTPHHVPVAVVGPPAVAAQLDRAARRPARCAPGLVARRCAVADRRSRGLRRLRGGDEPPVRRLGRQPRDRHRAGADVRPRRRRAGPAGRPRHRRQAAAAQGSRTAPRRSTR